MATRMKQHMRWARDQFFGVLSGEDPDLDPGPMDDWSDERRRVARLVDHSVSVRELAAEFTGAATQDNPLGNYSVSRDEAIRWAVKYSVEFPLFPFTQDDLPTEENGPVFRNAPAGPQSRSAEWLRSMMGSSGPHGILSTHALSDLSHVDDKTIRRWRDGYRPSREDVVERIAHVLGVDVRQIPEN